MFLFNYLAIVGLMLAVIAVSLINMDFIMNHFIEKSPDFKQINSADLYSSSGELNGSWPEQYGGWLELVDEEGNIVAVEGEKLDDIVSYQNDRLFAEMDLYRSGHSTIYHAYSVAATSGETYVLLWKIPERTLNSILALGIFLFSLIVFLMTGLYFYTQYSVRQMKKPLQQIIDGIKKMERLHYGTRLDFEAEKEFAEIRDAFNGMAERLQQASADKEKAEIHKQNLLLHLSHDLKTPITSILGYSQLLLDHPLSDEKERRKYVQYIHGKSSYMSKLIQDLFELAKLDDHHLSLDLQVVNLTKWYQQAMAEFYTEIEHAGFRLRAEIPETPLYVMIDHMQMNRVVGNLISNALKYNPEGTELYVSCDKRAGSAVLSFGDNGVGFTEQEREELFMEFVRGTSANKDGTGLGLAICRKIIARHQGSIELVTSAKYPTLFHINLPLANGSEDVHSLRLI
ncbi:sensor histidine kinase [Paenibacillus lentus]|uniref:histidine kinase n=2 Tax=Paenibacillus lentus TaxID=1338368 RepID=A0A3S8S1L0_9BACL|nr:sensor histidine kinase [Paenibacillus lentus]